MTIDILTSPDRETQLALARSQLVNLTTSYGDEADIFAELVQNAIDAVKRRYEDDQEFAPEITVVFGKRPTGPHYLYVQDNGCGMPPDVATKVFIPAFSHDKEQGKSIGYKGVGLSFLLAISSQLAMTTIDASGSETALTIKHTNAWVEDPEKDPPAVSAEFDVPSTVKDIASQLSQGTGVYFEFHPGTRPRTLSRVVLGEKNDPDVELQRWATYLASKTAVGVALARGEEDAIPMHVKVVLDTDAAVHERVFRRRRYRPTEDEIGYPFPAEVLRTAKERKEILDTPPEDQIQHINKHGAIVHQWSPEELLEEVKLDDAEQELLAEHLEWVSVWLAHSTDVFKTMRDRMGTHAAVVSPGVRLVVDGVPQGRTMNIRLDRDVGLANNLHVVVSLKGANLDTGRKILADETMKSAVEKVANWAGQEQTKLKWALQKRDRPPAAENIKKWIKDVDARAGNSVLPELFAALELEPPARVDPDNEQEVIALWTALLTGGVLPGYEVRATSSYNQYDSLVNVTETAFDRDGFLPVVIAAPKPKANAVLEYKLNFNDLDEEFANGVKRATEIDLVVCWDCPDIAYSQGNLEPTYAEWGDKRRYRAESYTYHDSGTNQRIPVIALRNVVAELMVANGLETGKPVLKRLVDRDSEKLI